MPKQKFKTFQLSTPLRGKYPPISPYKNLRLRNTSERGKGISRRASRWGGRQEESEEEEEEER